MLPVHSVIKRSWILDELDGGKYRITLPNTHQEEFGNLDDAAKFLVAVIKSADSEERKHE